jgi:succinate dehydrogenase / fumarate reductase membrane anchor subunit
LVLSAVTLIPVFLLMLNHVIHYYNESPAMLGLGKVIESQVPFIIGITGSFIAALVFSGLAGLIVGNKPTDSRSKIRGSKSERFWWSYMRLSGLLIVPLVFGHLAMMHVVQGVFDLTVSGMNVVGVSATSDALIGNALNDTGTAVEYVGERWNYLVASVAVWRFYDFALLALAGIHGFNGLRYVLTDYTMSSPLLRRAAVYVCIIGATVTLVVGAGALIGTIDRTAVKIALEHRYEMGLGIRQVEGFESQHLNELLDEIGITVTGEEVEAVVTEVPESNDAATEDVEQPADEDTSTDVDTATDAEEDGSAEGE